MVLSEGKTGHVGGCCTALITYVIQRCTLQTWKNKKIKKLRRWEGGCVWHDSMIFFCSATALDPSPKGFENPHTLPNYKNPLFLFLPPFVFFSVICGLWWIYPRDLPQGRTIAQFLTRFWREKNGHFLGCIPGAGVGLVTVLAISRLSFL